MTPVTSNVTRILILDDHALFRESVGRLVDSEPGFHMAGGCASVAEALAILDRTPVDLVLLDFDLGKERGSEFLTRARERGFTGRVLMVTAGMSDSQVLNSLGDGAAGVVFKHAPPEALFEAIRAVVRGETVVDQHYLQLLASGPPADDAGKPLTDRELQVLAGIFEGLANKEIGDRLHVSESSVKATLQQLFRKTGVRTRSQLVRIALEQYREQLKL
jgi:DNA-binding NarL/FixJ family response regulator